MERIKELPNMEMVEALDDKCGVDVNAHAVVAEPGKRANVKNWVEGGTALHVLANTLYFWQLEALKYLI